MYCYYTECILRSCAWGSQNRNCLTRDVDKTYHNLDISNQVFYWVIFNFKLKMSAGKKMSNEEAYTVGMARESWCAVECSSKQDWCRATRKHHQEQFSSTVFQTQAPSNSDSRCEFNPKREKTAQRKHFCQQCKSEFIHLVIDLFYFF